jgi:hypothetical protein
LSWQLGGEVGGTDQVAFESRDEDIDLHGTLGEPGSSMVLVASTGRKGDEWTQ